MKVFLLVLSLRATVLATPTEQAELSIEEDTPAEGFRPSDNYSRIVGGEFYNIEQAPYQVALERFEDHICGGSIIDRQHILTAAHCVVGYTADAFRVRAGSSIRNTGGAVYQVIKVTVHPKSRLLLEDSNKPNFHPYQSNANSGQAKIVIMPWSNAVKKKDVYDYDICVLKLEKSIRFSRKVRAIVLSKKMPHPGDKIKITGWGATEGRGPVSIHLRVVVLPVVIKQICQRAYMNVNEITVRMFCGGYPEGGRDSCQGDSGGPAVVNGELTGVVSFGHGCAKRHTPGVYAAVPRYMKWIKQNSYVQ